MCIGRRFVDVTRRGMLRLAAAAWVLSQLGAGGASAQDPCTPTLPQEVVGVSIPQTDLARRAALLVQTEAPPVLFHHSLRTFVLASLYARKKGWQYDEETVFVSSILHDIGLISKFADPTKTFEQAGADYARAFVQKFKPQDRADPMWEVKVDRIWKGILWHAGNVPSDVTDANIKMIQMGASLDVFDRPKEISAAELEAIQNEPSLRRCEFKKEFKGILRNHIAEPRQPARWIGPFLASDDPENRWDN